MRAKEKKSREQEEAVGKTIRRLRLGVDVAVSYRDLGYFEKLGFEVVCLARTSESDESWVARARAAGAHMIASNDRGVRSLAWKLGMVWVDIPEGLKRPGIRHAIAQKAQQLIANDEVDLSPTG